MPARTRAALKRDGSWFLKCYEMAGQRRSSMFNRDFTDKKRRKCKQYNKHIKLFKNYYDTYLKQKMTDH